MKFEVRWNNGFWKVFDTEKYTDVAVWYLKVDADEHAALLNK